VVEYESFPSGEIWYVRENPRQGLRLIRRIIRKFLAVIFPSIITK